MKEFLEEFFETEIDFTKMLNTLKTSMSFWLSIIIFSSLTLMFIFSLGEVSEPSPLDWGTVITWVLMFTIIWGLGFIVGSHYQKNK